MLANKTPNKVTFTKRGPDYIIKESRFYGLNTITNWMARYIYLIILKRVDYEPNILVSEIIKLEDIPNQNVFQIKKTDKIKDKKNRSPGWKKLIVEWEKKVDEELKTPSSKHARILAKIDKINEYILHLSKPEIITTWAKEIIKYAKKFKITIMDISFSATNVTLKDINTLESQFFPYYLTRANQLI